MKSFFFTLMIMIGTITFTSCSQEMIVPDNDSVTAAKTEVVVITPANPTENNCNKDDDTETTLFIKVIDETEFPLSNILVELEGNETYNFETNPEGEDEKVIETGSYGLLVEDGNTPLMILETTYNEGVLTIQIQE